MIPYFAHTALDIPPLDDLIDISEVRLAQMKATTTPDPEEDLDDDEDLLPDD